MLVALATVVGVALDDRGDRESSSETPKATEIGVTAKEIRWVIADVDTPRPRTVQGRRRRGEGAASTSTASGGAVSPAASWSSTSSTRT